MPNFNHAQKAPESIEQFDKASHSQDSDCRLSADGLECLDCGVSHGDGCPECEGRGFHADGCPLLSCYVRAMIPRMAKRAGISKRVHAHALRHSHAVELIEEGANVAEIRDQLGHSSIAVTDAYLNKSRMNRSRITRIHSREW